MDKKLAEWASSNGRTEDEWAEEECTEEEMARDEMEREENEWLDDWEDLMDDQWLPMGAPTEMEMSHTEVTVTKKPKCDFCDEVAEYDGKTTLGPWANMCATCYGQFGTGLGLGKGQKLVTKE